MPGIGHFPRMSITAIVENDTIKLPEGVHWPDGTKVHLEPELSKRRTLAERYAKLVGIADDVPTDLARNLDHYLHGHAKKP